MPRRLLHARRRQAGVVLMIGMVMLLMLTLAVWVS